MLVVICGSLLASIFQNGSGMAYRSGTINIVLLAGNIFNFPWISAADELALYIILGA